MTDPVVEPDHDTRRAAIAEFDEHFGGRPEFLVRSPGRVNLIGDHTDYNEGFVLPMAIDRHVWLAVRARRDRRVEARSDGYPPVAIDLDDIQPLDIVWAQYVAGVAWSLSMGNRPLSGWEGVVASNVPAGAGLSSSAALELAVARAFAEVSSLPWDATEMALAAQRAENDWVGMACGIMDQLVVAAAERGALLIDCRSLDTTPVPVPQGWSVVVIDSGTRRSLVDSAYNERRAACESAAAAMGVRTLRDATMDDVDAANVTDVIRRRARHVVSENARVEAAAAAMRDGDAHRAGELMVQSHLSLRDDYEVSAPALDLLVDALVESDGVAGARMTGAGFGGCVVALVAAGAVVEEVGRTIRIAHDAGLDDATAYVTRPVAGTSIEHDD